MTEREDILLQNDRKASEAMQIKERAEGQRIKKGSVEPTYEPKQAVKESDD